MKKIVAILLVFVMLLGFSACKDEKKPSGNKDNSQSASKKESESSDDTTPVVDGFAAPTEEQKDCKHTIVSVPAVPATCTTAGFTEGKRCSKCGYVTERQMRISKTEHTYKLSVVKPTCSTGGYNLYKCSCGNSYKENVVSPTYQHNFVNKQFSDEGHKYESIGCSRCSVEIIEYGNLDGSSPDTPRAGKYYISGKSHNPGQSATLVIYGTGAIPNVEGLPHYHMEHVGKIIIGDGISSIGNYAFADPINCVKEIHIGAGVKTIGAYALKGLRLEKLIFGKSVESIAYTAFEPKNVKKCYYPKSIKYMGPCSWSNTMYYEGTKEELAKVTAGSSRTPINQMDSYERIICNTDVWE